MDGIIFCFLTARQLIPSKTKAMMMDNLYAIKTINVLNK